MEASTLTITDAAPVRRFLEALAATDDSVAPALQRVALGLVLFPHGAQKAFGWWGGYGFEGTMGYLTGNVGLPWLVAFLVIAIELVGALALVAGIASRAAALGVIAVMVGAVSTHHLEYGFFMNWSGAQGGEGFEYHLLAIALAAGVLLTGSGRWSVDRRVAVGA